MKTLALTGGIASGKSTVANLFSEMGAQVINADKLAHRVYLPGTQVYEALLKRYGKTILDSQQGINRQTLARIIFSSPEEKKWAEQQIHPETRKIIEEELKTARSKNPPLILVEAALHLETGYEKAFDGLIVVDINSEIQKARLLRRDKLSPEELKDRLKNQMPLEEKRKRADWLIDNSGDLEKTRRQVEKLFGELTEKN